MNEHETLHLEINVRVEHDPQSVECARAWRFQIAIFDGKTVLDHARCRLHPEVHEAIQKRRLLLGRRSRKPVLADLFHARLPDSSELNSGVSVIRSGFESPPAAPGACLVRPAARLFRANEPARTRAACTPA